MNMQVRDRFTPSLPTAAIDLCPSQEKALERVGTLIEKSPIVGLWSQPGLGKTTVLAKAAVQFNAHYVDLGDVLDFLAPLNSDSWDDALVLWLFDKVAAADDVLVIDGLLDLRNCCFSSQRGFDGMVTTIEMLYREVERLGKRLILSGTRPDLETSAHKVFKRPDVPVVDIANFSHEDYAAIVGGIVSPGAAASIDFDEVFRFAAILNGHQLRTICSVLCADGTIDTATFLATLQEFVVAANVASREVERISFDTMPGMEDIAEQLETHVVLPLTDMKLAAQYDLRAKRGVLLYGPPGTGKTSVGRALAHRLKGRFFLIDGSVRTEPAHLFLEKIQAIMREAVANAPSVVFIDDADILFDVGHVAGLGRYLLTLLDGLNGVDAGKVCIMMTAMDPGKVPEAILRSGRVELWLETQLPAAPLRAGILARWMGDKIPAFAGADFGRIGDMTGAFTPADLRRVVADAKALYAADHLHHRELQDGTYYLERAVRDIVATREAMARNLADPSLRVG